MNDGLEVKASAVRIRPKSTSRSQIVEIKDGDVGDLEFHCIASISSRLMAAAFAKIVM